MYGCAQAWEAGLKRFLSDDPSSTYSAATPAVAQAAMASAAVAAAAEETNGGSGGEDSNGRGSALGPAPPITTDFMDGKNDEQTGPGLNFFPSVISFYQGDQNASVKF